MTIGDILAVIAAVLLVGASWAATILMIALAFPGAGGGGAGEADGSAGGLSRDGGWRCC